MRLSRKEISRKWIRNNPEKAMVGDARQRAKKSGVPFSINYADIIIPNTCPVLGVALSRGSRGFTANSPSLDRLVPDLGYVKGNIMVISHRANVLKGNATVEEMSSILTYMKVHCGKSH